MCQFIHDIKMPKMATKLNKGTRIILKSIRFWTDNALMSIHWFLNQLEQRIAVFMK